MSEKTEKHRPKRTFAQRVRWLLIAALVVIGGVRCFQWARDAYINHHGAKEQARVLARIEQAGIPIGYEALKQWAPPDDGVLSEKAKRAADLILAAYRLKVLQSGLLDDLPAVGAHESKGFGTPYEPEVIDGMRRAVRELDTMHTLFEQALAIGVVQADFDPTANDAWASEDPRAFIRFMTNWYSMRAVLAMAEGDGDRALRLSLKNFTVGDLYARYHDNVAPFMRFAAYSYAAEDVRRTLGYTQPSAEDLVRTRQSLVEHLDKISLDRVLVTNLAIGGWYLKHAEHRLITSLQGYSEAMTKDHVRFPYIRSRVVGPYGNPIKRPESVWERYGWIGGVLERFGVDLEELEASEEEPALVDSYHQRLNELVHRPGVAQAALARVLEAELDCYLAIKAGNEKTLFLRGDLDEGQVYPVRVTRVYRSMQASISLAIALIDLELYHREHGGWPENVDGLKGWPTDPFGGDPIRYRRTGDGCMVWAIGQNHVDDHGERRDEKDDIAFRLLNPALRGKVEPEED